MANHSENFQASLTLNFESHNQSEGEKIHKSDLNRIHESKLAKWINTHTGVQYEELKNQQLGKRSNGRHIIYFQNTQQLITNGWLYKLNFCWPMFSISEGPTLLNTATNDVPVYGISALARPNPPSRVVIVEDPLLALFFKNFLEDYHVIAAPEFKLPSRYVQLLKNKKVRILPDPEDLPVQRAEQLHMLLQQEIEDCKLIRWGPYNLTRIGKPIVLYIQCWMMVNYQEISNPLADSFSELMRERIKSQILEHF